MCKVKSWCEAYQSYFWLLFVWDDFDFLFILSVWYHLRPPYETNFIICTLFEQDSILATIKQNASVSYVTSENKMPTFSTLPPFFWGRPLLVDYLSLIPSETKFIICNIFGKYAIISLKKVKVYHMHQVRSWLKSCQVYFQTTFSLEDSLSLLIVSVCYYISIQ